MYHVGSSYDFGCICDRGLIAGGLGFREEPQTCFFTAVDPQVATMLTPRFEANAPRTILEKMKWEPVHNAVCCFDFATRAKQRTGILADLLKCNQTL